MHYFLAALSASAIWAWFVAHQIVFAWIGAVLVEQLPPPDATSSKLYAYAYSVLQAIAANLRRSKDAVQVVQKP